MCVVSPSLAPRSVEGSGPQGAAVYSLEWSSGIYTHSRSLAKWIGLLRSKSDSPWLWGCRLTKAGVGAVAGAEISVSPVVCAAQDRKSTFPLKTVARHCKIAQAADCLLELLTD